MSKRKLRTGSAALACIYCGTVAAAPTFKILDHERLDLTARVEASGQQHLAFDAYGHHFDVDLEPNDAIARGVSANRSDIKPYKGTVAGQSGSWARLTQTRDGWRGVVDDGQDLYAIEPANELRHSAVQPLPDGGSSATPVIYRLADAITDGAAYCGTQINENLTPTSNDRPTALEAFTHIATELSNKDTARLPTRELVVGVIADHTFTDAAGPDPEGAIVARMDIVDGIWSTQAGIRVVLGPVTILSDKDDFFSSTSVPGDLLAEVSSYRSRLSAHTDTGLTHLMTGRAMNGNIIGIAYLGAICEGADSVSLSQSTISTVMGALVAAHELGHNFNAVHDGVPGVCSATAQTYLMAPVINMSNQFSACSLSRIAMRAETARCLVQIPPLAGGPMTGGTVPGSTSIDGNPSGGNGSSIGGGDGAAPTGGSGGSNGSNGGDGGSNAGTATSGGGGRLDFGWLAFLGSLFVLQRARPLLQRRAAETQLNETRNQGRTDQCGRRGNGRASRSGIPGVRLASRDRSH